MEGCSRVARRQLKERLVGRREEAMEGESSTISPPMSYRRRRTRPQADALGSYLCWLSSLLPLFALVSLRSYLS